MPGQAGDGDGESRGGQVAGPLHHRGGRPGKPVAQDDPHRPAIGVEGARMLGDRHGVIVGEVTTRLTGQEVRLT